MVARRFVVGAGGAALLATVACAKFATDADPVDAGALSAPDAAPAPPVLCMPLPPSSDPGAVCQSCTPEPLFNSTLCDAVIASENKLYAMAGGKVLGTGTDDIKKSLLQPLDGDNVIGGRVLGMGLDAENVYVATDSTIQRIARSGSSPTAVLPKSPFVPPGAAPVSFGRTLFVQLQAGLVLTAPFAGPADAVQSLSVSPTVGLALDGDAAYWLGKSIGGQPAVLGPFPRADEQTLVREVVRGFAVQGAFAFVAEAAADDRQTVISRITLRTGGGGSRVVLANEPGVVESVHASGGRVYWVSRRAPGQGDLVFVSVDECGGVPAVTAADLPLLGKNLSLSFAGEWAYFVSDLRKIHRMKK